MIALETTFLVDYLNGESAVKTFLEEHSDKPFFAPSLALFETYRGAAKTGGSEGVERTTNALDWVEPIDLTVASAREAVIIEAELPEEGAPINLRDIMIAGICRHNGARLVTRDGHFDEVEGLETMAY